MSDDRVDGHRWPLSSMRVLDEIHDQVRLGEDPKVWLLIVIGVREGRCEELLAVEDGHSESTESRAGCPRS